MKVLKIDIKPGPKGEVASVLLQDEDSEYRAYYTVLKAMGVLILRPNGCIDTFYGNSYNLDTEDETAIIEAIASKVMEWA